MGSWVEVSCNCPNRLPLPGSRWTEQPHYRKRRKTNAELAEIAAWKETTRDMYACGHRLGLVVEDWPGDFMDLGSMIGDYLPEHRGAFEIFARVSNRRNYYDNDFGELAITPQQAEQWLLEIDEFEKALAGSAVLPHAQLDKLLREWFRSHHWYKVTEDYEVRGIPIPRRPKEPEVLRLTPEEDAWTRNKIRNVLEIAARLCRASIEVDRPIRIRL